MRPAARFASAPASAGYAQTPLRAAGPVVRVRPAGTGRNAAASDVRIGAGTLPSAPQTRARSAVRSAMPSASSFPSLSDPGPVSPAPPLSAPVPSVRTCAAGSSGGSHSHRKLTFPESRPCWPGTAAAGPVRVRVVEKAVPVRDRTDCPVRVWAAGRASVQPVTCAGSRAKRCHHVDARTQRADVRRGSGQSRGSCAAPVAHKDSCDVATRSHCHCHRRHRCCWTSFPRPVSASEGDGDDDKHDRRRTDLLFLPLLLCGFAGPLVPFASQRRIGHWFEREIGPRTRVEVAPVPVFEETGSHIGTVSVKKVIG